MALVSEVQRERDAPMIPIRRRAASTDWMQDYVDEEGIRSEVCGHKRGFWSRKIAKRAAKMTQKMSGQRKERMTVYVCPHCGMYHVAHKKVQGYIKPKETQP